MATSKSNKVTLTDKKLANLKAQARDYELSDAGCKGLRVRVTPGKTSRMVPSRSRRKKLPPGARTQIPLSLVGATPPPLT